MAQTRKQAENFGVSFVQDEVVDMDFSQKIKTIKEFQKMNLCL